MSAQWSQRREAGSRFAMRLLRAVAMHAGRGFARIWLYPITLYFFVRRGRERRDSRAFLARALGRPARSDDILKHIHAYASTLLDRLFLLRDANMNRFAIQIHGLDQLTTQMARGRGVLLLGAHIGSFEALRALSLLRPEVPLRVVMDLKQTRALNELLHALNPKVANNVIDAGVDPGALALALSDAARQGALIGLLADRSRAAEPTAAAPFFGDSFRPRPTSSPRCSSCRSCSRLPCIVAAIATSCISRRSPPTSKFCAANAPRSCRPWCNGSPRAWNTMSGSIPTTGSTSMISGIALLTSLVLSASPAPAEPTAQTPLAQATSALIERLGRPAPADTAFAEVAFLHLLQRPLLQRGQLHYGGADNLAKQVDTPYHETTTIAGNEVRVQREGRPLQRFSLERAPELQGLLASFSALLGGDAVALDRHFAIALESTGANWRLVLTPRAPALANKFRDMTVDGVAGEPHCFTLHEADGDTRVMLLGALAASTWPEVPTRAAVDTRCRHAQP
jgi:predicted LPLAT superfamily acyltransferase